MAFPHPPSGRPLARALAPFAAAFACLFALDPACAQVTTERSPGLRDNTPQWHALTGARVVVAPGRVIENGTLVMRDGVITAVGAGLAAPAGARVWNLRGRTVYAGFIDLHSRVGVPANLLPDPKATAVASLDEDSEDPDPDRGPAKPRALSHRSISASNALMRPEQDVAQQLQWPSAAAKAARQIGFTAVLAAPGVGVFRGQSALIALANPEGVGSSARAVVLAPRVAQHLAFEFNSPRSDTYPTSLMGSIALARQALWDARWQARVRAQGALASPAAERIEANASLDALADVLDGKQPVMFHARDEQDDARLLRLRDEFKLRAVVLGTGREYRRIDTLKAAGVPVVVPLNFPQAPAVADPDDALNTPLEALQHWEQAPANAARLVQAGIPIALTAAGLKDPAKEFWPALRKAIRQGLTPDAALAALTTQPAALLGQAQRLGTLEPGALAQVVVARGDVFRDDDAEIELSFVDGRPQATDAWGKTDWRGHWRVTGDPSLTLEISGSTQAPQVRLQGQKCPLQARDTQTGHWVLNWPCEAVGSGATARPGAQRQTWVFRWLDDRLSGTRQLGDGPMTAWEARRVASAAPTSAPTSVAADQASVPRSGRPGPGPREAKAGAPAGAGSFAARYPAGAFGIALPEQPATLLIQGATVWTQGPAGRLAQADVLVRQGKIAAVGPGLAVPAGAVIIDARGKHLTPGLIDAHSHIAIAQGVNEGSDSVTAEVRIGDVLDATDINIYRQLAGGLTAANLLHGSANTIGGQSQVIKLRWGQTAPALVFEGAAPTNKFALGENVKRSNWGGGGRYPATRMGVEQILRDQFAAAAEYAARWKAWRAKPEGQPEPRTDLRLQALAEILERKRLVHIHSYRADEILMFARLAQEIGIEVAAFQHVLEGYKVADAIADIGAGGSTFSDWWAFKMEVMDAVPHNGALMHRVGVLTSFNSDDADLARRMNVEAAKAVKYGGLSEVEALNFVTLNAARQLRIDQRVGSLETGKDADLVIWSGHPLSPTSRAEQTWIDGRRYFSLDADARLQQDARAERQRLVQRVLADAGKEAGKAGSKPAKTAAAEPDAATATAARTNQAHQATARALSQLTRQARHHRHSYSDAGSWHECTEDAP
jgi:imidazolonepropionase-like amidohydrolase